MSTRPTVTLTAYNMGDNCDERDFDAWASYVNDRIDELCGSTVEVDQHPFPNGPASDTIQADDEQSIRDALSTLWEQFCADPGAWPVRE